MREWISAHCIEDPGNEVTVKWAYAAYLRWCKEHEPESPMSLFAFRMTIPDWAPIEDCRRGRLIGVKIARATA